mmetsp:Transcript_7129/g.11648  ORF Transcript_7129/g.11648 Transcript_7129/m.11648 type:complete len:213 (-) Transcript_7129:1125-1763(-)
MMRAVFFLLSAICCNETAAFLASSSRGAIRRFSATRSYVHSLDDAELSTPLTRKGFVEGIAQSSCGLLVLSQIEPALASGGATAGGAYLLSAKQRYNKRVTAGLKAFLSLDLNDISAVAAFFETKDEGGWEDLSAAAYLLANAFRTNSSKAPDSLPSVKSWKAFAKDVDLLQRGLAKKDMGKVASSYKNAEEKLDEYLANVELPTVMELKQM